MATIEFFVSIIHEKLIVNYKMQKG